MKHKATRTINRVEEFEVKPSDVYTNRNARDHILKTIKEGWHVIAFRPLQSGDFFIPAHHAQGVNQALEYSTIINQENEPRLIVSRQKIEDFWE